MIEKTITDNLRASIVGGFFQEDSRVFRVTSLESNIQMGLYVTVTGVEKDGTIAYKNKRQTLAYMFEQQFQRVDPNNLSPAQKAVYFTV